MDNNKDIRWKQRFNSFEKAILKIKEVVDNINSIDELSDLESEGLIQRFEYTSELAWKVLKDFLESKGYINIKSPNDVLKQSFEDGYINNHDAWRRMNKARNTTSHTYNKGDAREIANEIVNNYYILLDSLYQRLQNELENENQLNLFE